MKVICRLIFVVLFIPFCAINSVYDTFMFIAIGNRHKIFTVLDWLSDKLLNDENI